MPTDTLEYGASDLVHVGDGIDVEEDMTWIREGVQGRSFHVSQALGPPVDGGDNETEDD